MQNAKAIYISILYHCRITSLQPFRFVSVSKMFVIGKTNNNWQLENKKKWVQKVKQTQKNESGVVKMSMSQFPVTNRISDY